MRLRAFTLQDFPVLTELWADPAVTRFTSGGPLDEEEVWSKLLRYQGMWALLGYGTWAVGLHGQQSPIGAVGLSQHRRRILAGQGAWAEWPEVSWTFAPAYHGQGLAFEAVSALLSWADRTGRGPGTICLIKSGNTASFRLAQRLGYTRLVTLQEPDEEEGVEVWQRVP